MPDIQLRGTSLKQNRQVSPAGGGMVGELRTVVYLDVLHLDTSEGHTT